MNRRDFIGSIGVLPALTQPGSAQESDRSYWIQTLHRLADPVLTSLARMPVEQAAGANRDGVTKLEALGRVIAGLAPWLERGEDGLAAQARGAIARAVDPSSPEFLN